MVFSFYQHKNGFTVAELLIALVILGLIAMLIIPKILTSVGTSQIQANCKNTLATLSDLAYTGYLKRETSRLKTESQTAQYYMSKLNAVKVCPNNALTEGCTTQTGISYSSENYPAVVMHDGSIIFFYNGASSTLPVWGFPEVFVDFNGDAPPNILAKDSDWGILVPADYTNTYGATGYWNVSKLKPGQASFTSSICDINTP
jgi:prepilin-type N-terminal cleavage/methylation domain-containing protein